ncbi:hypothetical protein SUVZ_15G2010 [Saccharomyces uvarum]|uniref:Aminopeptidase n=1 Tax=Saccharomyces uvarum TaxID=230603 RepID=A0ABN8WPF8_SACUV|nr:hypothetical protein SUVZ_15G2010 [Saccharomyces uvarum]
MSREVLPTNVTPLHYDIALEPDLETFKFEGSAKIDLQINDHSIDSVELNSLEIDFHSVFLEGVSATEIKKDESQQTVAFVFPNGTLKNLGDSAKLEINFTGSLNDQMAGFYRARYTDKITGETKYMATTQMEATDARRAFPCFDEPNLKATFDITLISESSLTHLSNMDVKTEVTEKGKKITTFNTTPKMSTYLVAFIVADLKYVENSNLRIPVRVYSTPGDEKLGQFAADLAARTLKFFENTFGIEYPLPKMDMVAVHEFSAGAMENWGLVTYRVIDLLLDMENSSLDRIQRVAEVIQHELAHQWFGNLVTMDWWEGLWLNEGFATWMSWYSCNEFQPEWKVWEQYVTDNLQRALNLDSLRSSHPIEVPVKNADEINQIFDAISYSKGSSLLRMISKWLGEEIFIKGVSRYLNKFKYGNAKTEDLWDALSETSGKDVRSVMNVWTKSIGFPVVSIKEENGKITLTQNRYLSTGDVKDEEDTTIYPVLLALKDKTGIDNSLVLNKRSTTFEVQNQDFFKLNGDQSCIFITSYSDERWTKLSTQAHLLSVEDRVGLVADAKALSASGYTSTTNFLNLISNWKDENSFVVWEQIINSLSALKSTWVFEPENVLNALDKFTLKLVSKKLSELGWNISEDDTFATQRLKVTLFNAACASGDKNMQNIAVEMFEKYNNGDKKAILALIKPAVFNTIAKIGDDVNYEKLLHIYQNPISSDEKIVALRALGRFEDSKLLERTLGYLLDGTVLNQDFYIPMQGIRAHKNGIERLWTWLQENWEKIVKRLQPGSPVLGGVLTLGLANFTSVEDLERISKFYSAKTTKGFDQTLAQAFDTIRARAQWVSRDREVVAAYLNEHENEQ